MRHGVPEVPSHLDVTTRRFLTELRNTVLDLQKGKMPPQPVTNLRATAMAGGNLVEFTRSDGDYYVLYKNSIAEFSSAVPIEIGLSATYFDDVGNSGITRHYWIRAFKENGARSEPVGPVSATTLGLTTGVTPPAPLLQFTDVSSSDETERAEGLIIGGGKPRTL